MRWLRGEILNSCSSSRETFRAKTMVGIRPNGSLLAQHKEVTERSSLIPLVDRRMRNALQWNRNVEPKQVLKWRNFQHGMGLNEFLKITQNRFYFEEAFLFLSVDLEGYKLLLFQESPVVDSLQQPSKQRNRPNCHKTVTHFHFVRGRIFLRFSRRDRIVRFGSANVGEIRPRRVFLTNAIKLIE